MSGYLKKLCSYVKTGYLSLDSGLFYGIAVLILYGIFLTFAASPGVAERTNRETFYFINRQLVFLVPAIMVLCVTTFLDTKLIRRISGLVLIGSLICMVYVVLFGTEIQGAKRWINIMGVGLQPSEFVKITYVMFIGGILYKGQSWKHIILSAFLAAVHIIILVLSSDLGTALIFSIVYIFLLYMATGKSYFLLGGLIAGSGAAVVAYQLFYHVKVRVEAWLDPWSIIDNKGYQITQSLFAIGTGGLFGMGLYEGMPNSIPVVDQDFMFSAIAEEFGTIFSVCVILLSLVIFLIFIRTSFKSTDDFYRLVCGGFAVLYGFQLFLTVGGAIKMIPSTGVTYPLISYGGSSLMSTVFMFFIVQGVKINENEQ